MAVEITDKCDRCGRTESLHITHDELIERMQHRKSVEETSNRISDAIREIWEEEPTNFPAVVTIMVKDDQLVINDKVSLCGPNPERKRGGQGCSSRVEKLVDEIHLEKSDKE